VKCKGCGNCRIKYNSNICVEGLNKTINTPFRIAGLLATTGTLSLSTFALLKLLMSPFVKNTSSSSSS
jgi:hypothetical protein